MWANSCKESDSDLDCRGGSNSGTIQDVQLNRNMTFFVNKRDFNTFFTLWSAAGKRCVGSVKQYQWKQNLKQPKNDINAELWLLRYLEYFLLPCKTPGNAGTPSLQEPTVKLAEQDQKISPELSFTHQVKAVDRSEHQSVKTVEFVLYCLCGFFMSEHQQLLIVVL